VERGNFDFIPDTCLSKPDRDLEILDQVITLAVEIAREGREGRKVGTIFTVFDAKKHITDPNLRETIKELSQLDGAFVIDDNGVALSACRFLDVTVENVALPLGLGSRHMAAASISKHTYCVAVAVSESSIVRIFVDGKIVSEIIPEIWLLKRYSVHLEQPYSKRMFDEMTVLDKETA
jgi:DNA integrity scanning protein DisA with diadenylate cyclase activity